MRRLSTEAAARRERRSQEARYTLESYTSTLDKHVLPFLGDFYYDQIGFIEVQHWVSRSLKRAELLLLLHAVPRRSLLLARWRLKPRVRVRAIRDDIEQRAAHVERLDARVTPLCFVSQHR